MPSGSNLQVGGQSIPETLTLIHYRGGVLRQRRSPDHPGVKFMPSRGSSHSFFAPIPEEFRHIKDLEWETPTRSRCIPCSMSRIYAPAKEDEETSRVPIVDQPVAALSSSSFHPSQGEGDTKDPCNCKADSALKRGFEAASTACFPSMALLPFLPWLLLPFLPWLLPWLGLIWPGLCTSSKPRLTSHAPSRIC